MSHVGPQFTLLKNSVLLFVSVSSTSVLLHDPAAGSLQSTPLRQSTVAGKDSSRIFLPSNLVRIDAPHIDPPLFRDNYASRQNARSAVLSAHFSRVHICVPFVKEATYTAEERSSLPRPLSLAAWPPLKSWLAELPLKDRDRVFCSDFRCFVQVTDLCGTYLGFSYGQVKFYSRQYSTARSKARGSPQHFLFTQVKDTAHPNSRRPSDKLDPRSESYTTEIFKLSIIVSS